MNKKEQDLLWYYEGERREMIEFIPESTSVCMDVGCGVGKFGILLKRHLQCSEVWGVEIDEDARIQRFNIIEIKSYILVAQDDKLSTCGS